MMPTSHELAHLSDAFRDQSVLSVYVNFDVKDPANRRAWRLDLRHALDEIGKTLSAASHAERQAFARCRQKAEERLEPVDVALASPGWAGFFGAAGTEQVAELPASVPTMAAWNSGPSLAPYVRALKEGRPVIAVVIDSRKARFFRYASRHLEPLPDIHSRIITEVPARLSRPARVGFHSGTRGQTAADELQRQQRDATARMVAEVAKHLSDLAGPDGWIVIGGIDTVAKSVFGHLPTTLQTRASVSPALDVHATRATVAAVTRKAASSMRDAADVARLDETRAEAEAHGRGATGLADTLQALDERRVRELLFTRTFLEGHPTEAENAVRLALRSGATVEHVSGVAAEHLDQLGGIAARLWYAPAASPAAADEGALVG
jgi:hypothetical protein